jgi:DnaJ-like protein
MSVGMALKTAIDLVHVPSQVRLRRVEPLPDGVEMLLRIAAGEGAAESAAVAETGRSRDLVRHAATFFIEQILFAPGADSYRILGANAQASAGELRRNVALLMRWLHPDSDPRSDRSIFVGRVTAAWNDLKTKERRAAYDLLHASHAEQGQDRDSRKSRLWRPGSRKQSKNPGQCRRQSRRRHRRGLDAVEFLRRALALVLRRPLVR